MKGPNEESLKSLGPETRRKKELGSDTRGISSGEDKRRLLEPNRRFRETDEASGQNILGYFDKESKKRRRGSQTQAPATCQAGASA